MGGELMMVMGETEGGAPYGLSLQEHLDFQAQDARRERRRREIRQARWDHLTVDLPRLAEALGEADPDLVRLLDLVTGEVIFWDGMEQMEHPEGPGDDPDRFLEIEPIPWGKIHGMAAAFTGGLPQGKPRRALEQALKSRRPLRMFRQALRRFPKERAAWATDRSSQILAWAEQWLDEWIHGAIRSGAPGRSSP